MLNGITLGIIITFVLLFLSIILSILISALLSPLTTTPNETLDDISDIIDPDKDDVFIDLGSGDGRLVIKIYQNSKCKCTGYEISPILIMYSELIKTLKFPTSKDITFEPENIFKVDLSKATKIYCYLDSKSLEILRPKLEAFVKDGGKVYSYMNRIEGVKKEKKVELKNKKYLYVYMK